MVWTYFREFKLRANDLVYEQPTNTGSNRNAFMGHQHKNSACRSTIPQYRHIYNLINSQQQWNNVNLTWFNLIVIWSPTANMSNLYCALQAIHNPDKSNRNPNCYLSNRNQYVALVENISDTLPILTGVPQGSILGPLLFIIYINDISQSNDKFKFITHADEPTLSSTMNNFPGTEIKTTDFLINDELDKVNEWLVN